jgi:protein-tyrosine-phosphatase
MNIELLLETSYDQVAERAKFTHFLPLMAERFARQHLATLARVEGKADAGVPIVLFLSVRNAGRSQMALGWFNLVVDGRAIGWSGGSEPSSHINPSVVEAMQEVGSYIEGEFPKPWTDEILRAADVVVTMGCGDACPTLPRTRYEDWQFDDPAGLGGEAVRAIRDAIGERVRGLVARLELPVA